MPNKAQSLRDVFVQAKQKTWVKGSMKRYRKGETVIEADDCSIDQDDHLEKWNTELCLVGMMYDLAGFQTQAEWIPEHREEYEDGAVGMVGDVFIDTTGDLKLCTLGQKLLCQAIDAEFPEHRQHREKDGAFFDFSSRENRTMGGAYYYGTENFIIYFNDAEDRTPEDIQRVLSRALEISKQQGL